MILLKVSRIPNRKYFQWLHSKTWRTYLESQARCSENLTNECPDWVARRPHLEFSHYLSIYWDNVGALVTGWKFYYVVTCKINKSDHRSEYESNFSG